MIFCFPLTFIVFIPVWNRGWISDQFRGQNLRPDPSRADDGEKNLISSVDVIESLHYVCFQLKKYIYQLIGVRMKPDQCCHLVVRNLNAAAASFILVKLNHVQSVFSHDV